MLSAIYIPGDTPIVEALTTPRAQAAIEAGYRLYVRPEGDGLLLHPDRMPAPGWVRGSVKVPA